jgi:acetyl esterase
MLDPQARALLDQMAEAGIPPVHTQTPAEARAAYRDRRGFTQPEPPMVGQVRDFAPDGLPMRLVRPLGAADDARLPLLLYFHGGGWTIGDLDTHDVLCRTLAADAGCAVLSVDYRMGPEHRFPAAVDDCLAALHYAQANATTLGIDARHIAVGGDSAGGNLAAVVCLLQRDAGAPMPVFQLLIYPATDMRGGTPSHSANGQGYLLTVDSMAYYRGHYMDDDLRPDAPPNPQWSDWRASPLLAASHAGLPPALVLTAGCDPLRDEGRLYADALSAAGTPAQYVCFERQIHGFITMGRVIDEANTAVDLCAAALRRAFHR